MSDQASGSNRSLDKNQSTVDVSPYESTEFQLELAEFIKLVAAIHSNPTIDDTPVPVDTQECSG